MFSFTPKASLESSSAVSTVAPARAREGGAYRASWDAVCRVAAVVTATQTLAPQSESSEYRSVCAKSRPHSV